MTPENTNSSSYGIKFYLSNPWNLIKTGFLVLTWIVMAIHIEIIGPTLPILANNVHVHYNGMGSALALRGVGYLVATILGAILQNIVKKHSEGLLILAFVLSSIAICVTPLVTSLILLGVLFFILGIGHGLTDLGGTKVLLGMWGVNSAAPLNIVRLGYGIGAIIMNFFVRPFLTEDKRKNSQIPNSNIFIPYFITAGLCILIAMGYVFFYIKELKNSRQILEIREVSNNRVEYAEVSTDPEKISPPVEEQLFSSYSPRTCGRGYFQYGLSISILFILSMFFTYGNEQTFSTFFFSYLRSEKFHISTKDASWSVIRYWFSYSIGRLITAIASVFVSVEMCLSIVWFAGLGLAITWLVFVWMIGLTETSLSILGILTGFTLGPIIPLTVAYFNKKLNVVPVLLALVLCGAAIGIMVFQKVAGYVMDFNPHFFPILLVICFGMSILSYVISNLIYFFHRKNHLSEGQRTNRGQTHH